MRSVDEVASHGEHFAKHEGYAATALGVLTPATRAFVRAMTKGHDAGHPRAAGAPGVDQYAQLWCGICRGLPPESYAEE